MTDKVKGLEVLGAWLDEALPLMPELPVKKKRAPGKEPPNHWLLHKVLKPGHCGDCLDRRVSGELTYAPGVAAFKRKEGGQWRFYCVICKERVARSEELAKVADERRDAETKRPR